MEYNKHMFKPPLYRKLSSLLLLSATFAILWVYMTREMYNYNLGFASMFGLSLFPVIGWTIGLAVGYILFTHILDVARVKGLPMRLAIVSVLCIVSVLIVETAGYYVFGVHNSGTAAYAGLPLCNCLHAPLWMQAGYFLLGPLYWLTYTALKTKIPMMTTPSKIRK